MKSFKGYLLNEVAWTESLSTMLFDLPRAGFKDIHIPLSPSIFKRIWPKPVRTKAFHLTDLVGVQRLKKMQGSKRSISAFYNMTDYMIQSGIRTDGGYVVELEGDVLAASPDDLSTQPDKSGRRWITVSTLMNSPTDSDPGLGGKSKLAGLEEDIQSLLERQIQVNGCRYVDETIVYESEEDLLNILRTVPWDVRIIGEEYINKEFTGKKEFDLPSKKVYYNYRQHTFSSSELRERITCKDK